jgi:hypothetical protein
MKINIPLGEIFLYRPICEPRAKSQRKWSVAKLRMQVLLELGLQDRLEVYIRIDEDVCLTIGQNVLCNLLNLQKISKVTGSVAKLRYKVLLCCTRQIGDMGLMKINILLGRGSFSTAQSIDETYKFRRHRK